MENVINYDNINRLIHKLSWEFARKHRQDPEDVLDLAHERLLDFIKTYDPARGAITTWVWVKTWAYLHNHTVRKARRRSIKVRTVNPQLLDGRAYSAKRTRQDAGQFLKKLRRQLSDDGAQAVTVALGCRSRKTLLEARLAERGWTRGRINRAFQEVRETLCR